jgi:hypothetical protein
VSVNVSKATAAVITVIVAALQNVMPSFGFEIGVAICDAAGCNWVAGCDILSTHTFSDALPQWIQ